MIKQVTVYRERERYAGWPANYGIWHWENEIVVGFTLGWMNLATEFHPRDKTRPFFNMQARSLDGGETWRVEEFIGNRPGGRGVSGDEHVIPALNTMTALKNEDIITIPDQPIDFIHPDFALFCARTGLDAGGRSFFYTSYDRCHSWQGPYFLPMFEQTAIAARTDYVIEGKHSCLLFLTANKSDGKEGRVFCARTTDGGQSFQFVSFLGEEPAEGGFAIMPSTIKLSNGKLLTAIRSRLRSGVEPETAWIDLYTSENQGQSWVQQKRAFNFDSPTHNGNPPALLQLDPQRLVLVYGRRNDPPAICARISQDDGNTWGCEITLRQTTGDHDMGYVRACVRPDGTVIAVYYTNDIHEGERYIEAVLWKP